MRDVRTALDAGISPLISDPTTGKTGLHHAAKFGRTNILHLLIQNGRYLIYSNVVKSINGVIFMVYIYFSAPKELLDMRDFEKYIT